MKMLRDWAGRPVTARVRPIAYELGGTPGIRILTEEDYEMAEKANKRGLYRLNGSQFRIREGDVIPDGAELVDERASNAAPENRAKKTAPENRSHKAKDAE